MKEPTDTPVVIQINEPVREKTAAFLDGDFDAFIFKIRYLLDLEAGVNDDRKEFVDMLYMIIDDIQAKRELVRTE